MLDAICKCGSPKSHHANLEQFIGMKLIDLTKNAMKQEMLSKVQKFNCSCLYFEQDNLRTLEQESIRKEV